MNTNSRLVIALKVVLVVFLVGIPTVVINYMQVDLRVGGNYGAILALPIGLGTALALYASLQTWDRIWVQIADALKVRFDSWVTSRAPQSRPRRLRRLFSDSFRLGCEALFRPSQFAVRFHGLSLEDLNSSSASARFSLASKFCIVIVVVAIPSILLALMATNKERTWSYAYVTLIPVGAIVSILWDLFRPRDRLALGDTVTPGLLWMYVIVVTFPIWAILLMIVEEYSGSIIHESIAHPVLMELVYAGAIPVCLFFGVMALAVGTINGVSHVTVQPYASALTVVSVSLFLGYSIMYPNSARNTQPLSYEANTIYVVLFVATVFVFYRAGNKGIIPFTAGIIPYLVGWIYCRLRNKPRGIRLLSFAHTFDEWRLLSYPAVGANYARLRIVDTELIQGILRFQIYSTRRSYRTLQDYAELLWQENDLATQCRSLSDLLPFEQFEVLGPLEASISLLTEHQHTDGFEDMYQFRTSVFAKLRELLVDTASNKHEAASDVNISTSRIQVIVEALDHISDQKIWSTMESARVWAGIVSTHLQMCCADPNLAAGRAFFDFFSQALEVKSLADISRTLSAITPILESKPSILFPILQTPLENIKKISETTGTSEFAQGTLAVVAQWQLLLDDSIGVIVQRNRSVFGAAQVAIISSWWRGILINEIREYTR